MENFQTLAQEGTLHAWIYVPTAILLGALHGLEPGHSKTMMAAFIIAVRGTVAQAALLGLCAALSHSLIIWLLAAAALHYGSQLDATAVEPYLQLFSAVLILGLSAWMAWRTRRDIQAESEHHHHRHHEHADAGASQWVDAGHVSVRVEIHENTAPAVFRLAFFERGNPAAIPDAQTVSIETLRADGTVEVFAFAPKGEFLESTAPIPEPHEFTATLNLAHGDHGHRYVVNFAEDHAHDHGAEYQDAHELAHAADVEKRFAGRAVTNGQIALFGLTGGLLPCPAAFTIVLVCLQLKRFALGIFMVLAFSAGLAFTLVATGALAAWSLRHAERRFTGFGKIARKLPYLSSALLALVALYIGLQGWWHLARAGQ
jgi:nickel/cobalt transporter (NicO) family protein